MRTFDYKRATEHLLDSKTEAALALLNQDKGKLDLLKSMHADELERLRSSAHRESVRSSTAIEGLYVSAPRVGELLDGSAPANETESQIVGYSNALRLIEGKPDALPVSASSAVLLFECLFLHRELGRKSRYRKKDYMYVQVDGHMEALPVSPVTAFETPLVLGSACDSLAEALDKGQVNPLLGNAVFTVDFLCIRPFDEGNGRIARLLSKLLLEKSGFDVLQYMSVDKVFEESGMAYYDALNGCVNGWDRATNDYAPYVSYWLDALHTAYVRLFDALELHIDARSSKSQRVRLFVQRAGQNVTKRQILQEFPDISEATVENVLGQMVKDGEVEKVGAGRSTAYRWLVGQ